MDHYVDFLDGGKGCRLFSSDSDSALKRNDGTHAFSWTSEQSLCKDWISFSTCACEFKKLSVRVCYGFYMFLKGNERTSLAIRSLHVKVSSGVRRKPERGFSKCSACGHRI